MVRDGRTDAMHALGRALLDCRLVGTMDDEAIQQYWIDSTLSTQKDNPGLISRAYAFLVASHLWMAQAAYAKDDADWQAAEQAAASALAPGESAQAQANGEAIFARYCARRGQD